jgi:cytochrome c-type biogenesis protein CcmE
MIATKKTKLLIISLAMASLLLLMLISVDPEVQYSVDEVVENPKDHENKDLFVRGDVLNNSLISEQKSFILSGINYEIIVDYSAASLPEGFQEGLPVAIKGKLVKIDNYWSLQASEIITGCPSKYETVDN